MKICNFPGSRRIGPPREWIEELDGSCGAVYVADNVDLLTGINMQYSCYKLSDEEIEALKAGGLLRLGIAGKTHPVFQLHVLGPKASADVPIEPMGDMGGVIEKP